MAIKRLRKHHQELDITAFLNLIVVLVPFLLSGVALVPELNGPDGVHPNAAGAQRIADTVWPFLQPLLSP